MTKIEALTDLLAKVKADKWTRNDDAWIAENVFRWRETPVPPDVNGVNGGLVLTPTGSIPIGFKFPPKGAIHPGYFAPHYTQRHSDAIALAVAAGIDIIPTSIARQPSTICAFAIKALIAMEKNDD
jgi:hypothetical protein